MRSVFPYFTNPFGPGCARPGTAGLVDKLIGNAFPIVEFVARNMTHIRRVSFYMKNVYDVSQRLTSLVPTVSPAAANTFVEITLPIAVIEAEDGSLSNRQVLSTDVLGWTVTLTDSAGTIYCDRHDLWTTAITATEMFRITLPSDAPSAILEADMKILFDYSIPAAVE